MRWTPSGDRRTPITLTGPDGPPVTVDGDSTQPMTALSPASVYAQVLPATARNMERLMAGTVVSSATEILVIPYHPGVTTKTVVTLDGVAMSVTGVVDPGRRHIETILAVTGVVE